MKRVRQLAALLMAVPALLVSVTIFGRSISEADRQHWAFQPLKPVQAPRGEGKSEVLTPIDRFILFQLTTNHLHLAPPATREQLIRRLSFDLIGLPPTI